MRGRVLSVSLALFVVAALAGCQNAKPPPAAQTATRATAETRPSAATLEEPRPASPLASLRGRGTLHGEPLRVPAGKYPERWLVFLGTPQIARAAWLVTPETNEIAPVEGWPAGVRVAGSVTRDAVLYLLLETVALLDQPAGLRGVWFDSFGNPSARMLAPASTFHGVRDVAELERRLDESAAPATYNPALLAALKAGAKNETTLTAALPIEGTDVYDVWQSSFFQHVDRLQASTLAWSPRAQDLLALARDALRNDHCDGETCEAGAHSSLTLGEEAGRWALRAVAYDAAPPRPKMRAAPHAVPNAESTTATEEVLREQVRTVRQLLGEAPLVGSGPIEGGEARATIGVAVTDLEEDGTPTIAIKDGAYARVFTLPSMATFAAKNADARFEARFADVDGDGRTDVVLRATGRASDASLQTLTRVFLAPPPSVQATDLAVDFASDLPLMTTATLDDAVAAALRVPTEGISAFDACTLLKGANTVATFRGIAAPDARVLTFEGADMPTYRAHAVAAVNARAADVKELGERCRDLECSPTRPYCAHADGFSEYYWFAGSGDARKLAGAAFYSGP